MPPENGGADPRVCLTLKSDFSTLAALNQDIQASRRKFFDDKPLLYHSALSARARIRADLFRLLVFGRGREGAGRTDGRECDDAARYRNAPLAKRFSSYPRQPPRTGQPGGDGQGH